MAVLDAFRACASSMGSTPAMLLSADPPQIVYEGVLHYARALDRVAEDDRAKAEKERRMAREKQERRR